MIAGNSRKIISGNDSDTLSAAEIANSRAAMKARGVDVSQVTDDQIQMMSTMMAKGFEENAPTTAAQAAQIMLDGVRAERWRILVGDDAHRMDEQVRADPENAYEPAFFETLTSNTGWRLGGGPQR